MIKPCRLAEQMPLAYYSGTITVLAENLRERLLSPIEISTVILHAIHMRIFSCEDNSPAWTANRVCYGRFPHKHPFPCDPVNMRRAYQLRPVSAHCLVRMIVIHDKNDIRP